MAVVIRPARASDAEPCGSRISMACNLLRPKIHGHDRAGELCDPGMLLPTRNAELSRWCLSEGLRVVQPLTQMSCGLYNEPRGAYMPSILF